MLERDWKKRLWRIEEIKDHPFLKSIDWERLARRDLPAPIKVNFY
jgi:hypothetical protein